MPARTKAAVQLLLSSSPAGMTCSSTKVGIQTYKKELLLHIKCKNKHKYISF